MAALAVVVLGAAVAGLIELRAEGRSRGLPRVPSAAATIPAVGLPPPPPPPATSTPAGTPARVNASPPVRIVIPEIGVDAPVIRLGLNADHTLQVPRAYDVTGWWSGGTTPGQTGPAVVVGHVDSTAGPAVFYRLRDLRAGARVIVHLRDGSTVTFAVQRLEEAPKAGFPTNEVYGATRSPTLRLITCGGSFDTATGHYVDNVIVFAAMTSAT